MPWHWHWTDIHISYCDSTSWNETEKTVQWVHICENTLRNTPAAVSLLQSMMHVALSKSMWKCQREWDTVKETYFLFEWRLIMKICLQCFSLKLRVHITFPSHIHGEKMMLEIKQPSVLIGPTDLSHYKTAKAKVNISSFLPGFSAPYFLFESLTLIQRTL